MAWIELHQSLPNHPKTWELIDILGIEEAHAVGYLSCLWLWSLDNAQDGRIKANPRTIARAARWKGDAVALCDALLESGFLHIEDDNYIIHDWHDYAGRLMEQKQRNAEKQKRYREKQEQSHADDKPLTQHNRNVTVTLPTNDGLPNLTEPNPTTPNPTTPNPTTPNPTQPDRKGVVTHEEDKAAPVPVGVVLPLNDFQEKLIRELRSFGFPHAEAETFARVHPDETRRQIDWLPTRRGVENVHAFLRKAITERFAPPRIHNPGGPAEPPRPTTVPVSQSPYRDLTQVLRKMPA